MPRSKNSRLRPQSDYKYTYLNSDEQRFDAEKYKDNELAIEMLHEGQIKAFVELSDLRDKLEDSQSRSHKLELQKNNYEIRLDEANNKIEKLIQLEQQMESYNIRLHIAELKNQELKLNLDHAEEKLNASRKNALLTFVASTFGGILFTLGANIVTSHPDNWLAWELTAAGIISGFIAFFISRRNS